MSQWLGLCILLLSGCNQWNARVAANAGHAAYLEKDFDKAIASYEEASLALPKNETIKRNLGYSYLAGSREDIPREDAQKKADKAITILGSLLEKEPSNTELASLLLDAWEQNNRLSEAVQFFKARLEKDPSDLQSLKGLGVVELKRGNYRDALSIYKKRLQISPNDESLYLLIAQTSWQWLRAGGPNDLSEAMDLASNAIDAAKEAAKRQPEKIEPLVFARLLLFQRVQLNKDNPDNIEKDRIEIESLNKKISDMNKKAEELLKKANAEGGKNE